MIKEAVIVTIKKRFLIGVLLIFSAGLLSLFWLYNYEIIGEHFDKLTVTSMGRNLVTIEDKTEIARIISEINQSPRSFQHDNGFTYDYLQMGILSFENDMEKLEIGFIIRNGNTVTKYWEIDTDFQFGKETE